MKKVQTVKSSRAAAYEKAKVKGLSFTFEGDAFRSVVIDTDLGPLTIELESYSIKLTEPAKETVYRATVTDSQGVFPTWTKDFADKYERERFVNEFDSERGRFEVAISDYDQISGETAVKPDDGIPF